MQATGEAFRTHSSVDLNASFLCMKKHRSNSCPMKADLLKRCSIILTSVKLFDVFAKQGKQPDDACTQNSMPKSCNVREEAQIFSLNLQEPSHRHRSQ